MSTDSTVVDDNSRSARVADALLGIMALVHISVAMVGISAILLPYFFVQGMQSGIDWMLEKPWWRIPLVLATASSTYFAVKYPIIQGVYDFWLAVWLAFDRWPPL